MKEKEKIIPDLSYFAEPVERDLEERNYQNCFCCPRMLQYEEDVTISYKCYFQTQPTQVRFRHLEAGRCYCHPDGTHFVDLAKNVKEAQFDGLTPTFCPRLTKDGRRIVNIKGRPSWAHSGYAALTLCWSCRNAVPSPDGEYGCSWSRKFEPVEGWKATPTVMQPSMRNQEYASYYVIDCPEYWRDEE